MYMNSDINFSSPFNSTLNSPIHYVVQTIVVHLLLQLSTVQFICPNSCSVFISTVNSQIQQSKFLSIFHFNSK